MSPKRKKKDTPLEIPGYYYVSFILIIYKTKGFREKSLF